MQNKEITIQLDDSKYYFVGVASGLYPEITPSYYAYKAAKWENIEIIRKEEEDILIGMHKDWEPKIIQIEEVCPEKYFEMCNADIITAVNFIEMQINSLPKKQSFNSRLNSLSTFFKKFCLK